MKFSLSYKVFFLSLFLFLIYLIINNNLLSLLLQWQTVSNEKYLFNQKSLKSLYQYAADNFLSQGYRREKSEEFFKRLNYSNNLVEIALPIGFLGGVVSFKTNTESKFQIVVWSDLGKEEIFEYPGFGQLTFYSLFLNKPAGGKLFLRFIPQDNKKFDILFDTFQFVLNTIANTKEKGLLFFPDFEVDYKGKIINQPGIYYEEK